MKKDHREDTVGPWAEEKLKALEDYLRYYCNALSKQRLTLVYIDGFAGAPIAKIRQAPATDSSLGLLSEEDLKIRDQFVLGSPIRALDIVAGFQRHYFFDLDERRVAALAALQAEYPDKRMISMVGDANVLVRKLVAQVGMNRDVKGIAFLDPYGPNLEWETVEALAKTKKFEVIINLPIHMALNRLLKTSERNPEWEALVDKCFGTEDWRSIVYPDRTDLFGDISNSKADGVPELLLALYLKRLREVFPHVSTPRLIRNRAKSPLYFLIWAGPHGLGLKGADYILGQGEKLAKKNR